MTEKSRDRHAMLTNIEAFGMPPIRPRSKRVFLIHRRWVSKIPEALEAT